ncbi:hypothetical protein CDAR_37891 [Caerostris darwini]|uniref:Aquaporin n=1 Tax=Caerostris darwini TaxID=1538125 RepID=A0AAV4T9S7_9ARAC|nr:hypothetical protein CDAR_37891 [Caerostris darwini]
MHRIALSTMGVEARFAILVFLEFLGGIVCGVQIGPVYRAVCGQPSVKTAAQFPKWPRITGGNFLAVPHMRQRPFRIPQIPPSLYFAMACLVLSFSGREAFAEEFPINYLGSSFDIWLRVCAAHIRKSILMVDE